MPLLDFYTLSEKVSDSKNLTFLFKSTYQGPSSLCFRGRNSFCVTCRLKECIGPKTFLFNISGTHTHLHTPTHTHSPKAPPTNTHTHTHHHTHRHKHTPTHTHTDTHTHTHMPFIYTPL